MTRVLHVLAAATDDTPPEEKRIPSECGHFCIASENTHALLSEPADHFVVCVDCLLSGAMDEVL